MKFNNNETFSIQQSRLALSLKLLTHTLLLFAAFRLLLLVAYYEEFASLSLFEMLQAFLYGLRFDLSVALTVLAIPLLLLNLPFAWAQSRRWVTTSYWLALPAIIVISLLMATDIAYYAYVKRHITQELQLMLHDIGFVVQMAFNSYKLALLIFTAFSVLLMLLWKVTLKKNIRPASAISRYTVFVILIAVILVGIRGGVQRKTINIIDAYAEGNPVQGNLILNGAYSAIRSMGNKQPVSHHYFTNEALMKQARQFNMLGPNKQRPFQQRNTDATPSKLNVVIVLLESWSYRYIDSLAGNNYGVTPNFDKLVRNGLAFNHFYAAGQRSIEGMQAVLTGVPNLVGLPNLGWGLESSKFTRLGHLVKSFGYQTLFAQSSRRTSFHIDGIAAATGFDSYYGMEDMQLELNYADPESFWYGWDHETFNKVHQHLQTTKPPFLSFIFTGSTHSPFGTLPKRFKKFPHGTDTEKGFLNTLYYADWAIGEFMKQASQQPWFDDTIFVFAADHALGKFHSNNTLQRFHIPLLIYSPKHIKPGINETIGSQYDIMPTIIELLELPATYSTFGQSLLSKKDPVAYVREGNISGIITEKGYLRHTLKKVVEANDLQHKPLDQQTRDELEQRLLTMDQLSYTALTNNTWAE